MSDKPPDFFFRVDFSADEITELMAIVRRDLMYSSSSSAASVLLLQRLESAGGRRPKTASSCPTCGAYDYGNVNCLACVDTWKPTPGVQELRRTLRVRDGVEK